MIHATKMVQHGMLRMRQSRPNGRGGRGVGWDDEPSTWDDHRAATLRWLTSRNSWPYAFQHQNVIELKLMTTAWKCDRCTQVHTVSGKKSLRQIRRNARHGEAERSPCQEPPNQIPRRPSATAVVGQVKQNRQSVDHRINLHVNCNAEEQARHNRSLSHGCTSERVDPVRGAGNGIEQISLLSHLQRPPRARA